MMTILRPTVTVLGLCALLAGCDRPADSSPRTESPREEAIQELREKTRETIRAAEALALQEKREFEKQIEAELATYRTLVAELKGRSSVATDRTREVLAREIEELETRKSALETRLAAFQEASEEAAEEVRRTVEAALADLKVSYEKALKSLEEDGN